MKVEHVDFDLLFVAEATRIHKNATKRVKAAALRNMKAWVAKDAEEVPYANEDTSEYVVLANAAAASRKMVDNVYG